MSTNSLTPNQKPQIREGPMPNPKAEPIGATFWHEV
jgi:hypothetical protein